MVRHNGLLRDLRKTPTGLDTKVDGFPSSSFVVDEKRTRRPSPLASVAHALLLEQRGPKDLWPSVTCTVFVKRRATVSRTKSRAGEFVPRFINARSDFIGGTGNFDALRREGTLEKDGTI